MTCQAPSKGCQGKRNTDICSQLLSLCMGERTQRWGSFRFHMRSEIFDFCCRAFAHASRLRAMAAYAVVPLAKLHFALLRRAGSCAIHAAHNGTVSTSIAGCPQGQRVALPERAFLWPGSARQVGTCCLRLFQVLEFVWIPQHALEEETL